MRFIKLPAYFFIIIFCFLAYAGQAQANSPAFSMSVWVKPFSSAASRAIAAKAEEIRLATNASGQPLCQIMSGSVWQTVAVSSQAIGINSWTHIACVYDNKYLKIYIDGEEKGSTALAVTSDDTSAPMKIGVDDSSGSSYGAYSGLVDEFLFYSYALTIDEVKILYNQSQAAVMGQPSEADDDGTTVTGAGTDYCIPGDTATCSPPVLELKFDEKTGTTTYDTSGEGNDGSFGPGTSTPTWTRGKIGSALLFDGVNDYVQTLNSPLNSSPSVGFSGFAWVKPTADGGQVWELGGSDCFDLYFNPGNGIRCRIRDSVNGYMWTNFTNLELDDWNYYGCVVDVVDNTFKQYVNGVETSSVDATNFSTFYNNGALNIGARGNYGGIAPMTGYIDDIKVYDYARTPAQIAWDYNRGKPIAHWKFDECSGGTIHDNSGNGNDGQLYLGAAGTTATGTCALNSDSFWYNGKDGKRNSAGSFDGGSDYVEVGDTGYDINSISFWLKADSNTEYIIDLDNGTRYIHANNGVITATGFSSPTIYVDGEQSSAIDTAWHHILIKTSTAIDVNNMDIGRVGANYFNGLIDEVKIFNYALTAEQVRTEFNGGSVRFGN